MKYEGHDRLSLHNENIYVQTSLSEITENRPYAYKLDKTGSRTTVDCQYRLKDSRLSFEMDQRPGKDEVLVIDPLLIFSTYSGSNVDNWGFTAAFDLEGNLYSGGIAFGPGFPSTSGKFNGGQMDVGILKYDSTGANLIYAAYIGGTDSESPHSLIVNENNELIILGTTSSTDFPTSLNAVQPVFGGGLSFVENGLFYNNGSELIHYQA